MKAKSLDLTALENEDVWPMSALDDQDEAKSSNQRRQFTSKNSGDKSKWAFDWKTYQNSQGWKTSRCENILCAMMALIKELDDVSLKLVKQEIEKKINGVE